MSCKGLSELAEMPADELEAYLNKQTKKKLVDMLLDEFLNEVDGEFEDDESEDNVSGDDVSEDDESEDD